jgi:hypothetical protein
MCVHDEILPAQGSSALVLKESIPYYHSKQRKPTATISSGQQPSNMSNSMHGARATFVYSISRYRFVSSISLSGDVVVSMQIAEQRRLWNVSNSRGTPELLRSYRLVSPSTSTIFHL